MSFSELLVTAIVILLVFPSKKIPELAKIVGRIIRYVKILKKDVLLSIEPLEKKIQLENNKKRAEEAERGLE